MTNLVFFFEKKRCQKFEVMLPFDKFSIKEKDY
jgi:hypothetical protein